MVDSSCPSENRQRRTDAARAAPQSQLAQESMRSKMEKTFGEQGTLSQAVVRIVNEAARDQEGNGDGGGSRTTQRGRRPAEGNHFGTRKATRLRQC